LLIRPWRILAVDKAAHATLANLDDRSEVDIEALEALLSRLNGFCP
jgi:hypothetical protein